MKMFFKNLFQPFLLLILATTGAAHVWAVSGNWHQVQYPSIIQNIELQSANVRSTARAPPLASDNVALTGGLFLGNGDAHTFDGAGTQWASLNFSGQFIATNRTGRDGDWFDNPQTRDYGEAGVNAGGVRFDGTPTAHEGRIGRELADQGLDVRIRGENVPGPDAQINGNWYDIKELTGTGRRSLQTSINSAKNNFSNDGAVGLGLGRSDTRALVDARGNSTWDNPASVRAEFDRLSRNGDLGNVAEVRVITSTGPVTWRRP